MHIPYAQDTSTQAMTEVALGLSMAFFALLIVALLSFQMPTSHDVNASSVASAENIKLSDSNTSQQAENASNTQFVFYYRERWVDEKLRALEPSSLAQDQPAVLAIQQEMSFSEVMRLKQTINHPNLSITLLTAEWQRLLEQSL